MQVSRYLYGGKKAGSMKLMTLEVGSSGTADTIWEEE